MAFNNLPFLFYRSPEVSPYYNLALEEHLFNNYGKDYNILMLWQNDNTVVIGKNQNTEAEINQLFVSENHINVARRLSGGGAVYHDLGNLNFTFIVNNQEQDFDFRLFSEPVVATLASFGLKAQASGRNDISLDGKKFSGNAQYSKKGITMHHGTILFDSNLNVLSQALKVRSAKIKPKGVTSTHSQVVNLKEYLDEHVSLEDFEEALKTQILKDSYTLYQPSEADLQKISELCNNKYVTWQWNFGNSPACQMVKEAYIENVGFIEIHLTLENGSIKEIYSYGDYFGNEGFYTIQKALDKCPFNMETLESALKNVSIEKVYHNLTTKKFIQFLLED